jgi:hypothetical protein
MEKIIKKVEVLLIKVKKSEVISEKEQKLLISGLRSTFLKNCFKHIGWCYFLVSLES